MKRLMLVVAVFALLAIPVTAVRSEGPLVEPDSFGEGWSIEVTEQAAPADGSWRTRLAYFGPNGNRAMILVYDLGDGISARAEDWNAVMSAMTIYSGATTEMINEADTTVPDGIDGISGVASDAIRFACLDEYGRVCGASAYAAASHPVAIIVRVDGTVNDRTDLAATDYVAGLYFAALSAE